MTVVSIMQGTHPTVDAIDQLDRLIDLQWALIAAIEVIHRDHDDPYVRGALALAQRQLDDLTDVRRLSADE